VSFLRTELEETDVLVSRIASGVPVGAPLEYIDRGTLSKAFSGRQKL